MLKPTDQGGPQNERPVGELVHQLVEEGKAYAQAEIAVVKAIAAAKAQALAVPAGLFVAALLIALAAIMTVALGAFFALYRVMSPLLAGLICLLIFGAIAGGLAWYGVQRLKRDL
jgi:hypothetical protein